MHRLIYTSQAAAPELVGSREYIEKLARSSAERNRETDITGALMMSGNTFVQVLEGKFAYLEETFERICCDFRHTNLRLIDLIPVEDRMFTEWSMALLAADKDTPAQFAEALDRIEFLIGTNTREAVKQMRTLLDDRMLMRAAA